MFIGITGGIGAGKSAVSAYLTERYQIPVMDTDTIGHEVMAKDDGSGKEGLAYRRIIDHFGEEVLGEDGEINRKVLGGIVFADANELELLNAIVHPAVEEEVKNRLARYQEAGIPIIAVETALFTEAGYDHFCDRSFYVHADTEVRIDRLQKTRGMSRERALQIMEAQRAEEAYEALADVVIDNSGDLSAMHAQVDRVIARYLELRLTPISSGSSGNVSLIETETTAVLVDAGISCKRIVAGLESVSCDPKKLSAVLITHEHSDHISGLRVLMKKYPITAIGTAGTFSSGPMAGIVKEIGKERFRVINPGDTYRIGDLLVKSFRIPHDAAEPVGYTFTYGKKKVAVSTDIGAPTDDIILNLSGAQAIILEANHDIHMLEVGSYPYPLKRRILGEYGHLSNENCGKLLSAIWHEELKTVFLGHLSEENNYPDLAAYAVRNILRENCSRYEEYTKIIVASRHQPSETAVV